MEIQVDERFKVKATRSGYEVYQYRQAVKGPKQGKWGWYSEGHFDTLPWALRGCYRLMLHSGRGKASLEQLAARIEQAEEVIVQALAETVLKGSK